MPSFRERLADIAFGRNGTDGRLPYVWSKGIAQYCDVSGPSSYWQAPTESFGSREMFEEYFAGVHGVVWVRLGTGARDGKQTDLELFVRQALPTISRPFVLLTTDGDASVPWDVAPETIEALLGSPFLRAWYSQNCLWEDGTILPFPIGLDLHTPRPLSTPRRLTETLERIAQAREPLGSQPLSVFSDFAVTMHSQERYEAVQTLGACEHVMMLGERVSQGDIWELYAGHPFVLSARGNGADCHRTWEALYLGSIVITKTSALDRLYAGLPVVIVDDWAEVLNIDNLARWREQYGQSAERQRIRQILDPQLMIERIRAAHLGGGAEGDASPVAWQVSAGDGTVVGA